MSITILLCSVLFVCLFTSNNLYNHVVFLSTLPLFIFSHGTFFIVIIIPVLGKLQFSGICAFAIRNTVVPLGSAFFFFFLNTPILHKQNHRTIPSS